MAVTPPNAMAIRDYCPYRAWSHESQLSNVGHRVQAFFEYPPNGVGCAGSRRRHAIATNAGQTGALNAELGRDQETA